MTPQCALYVTCWQASSRASICLRCRGINGRRVIADTRSPCWTSVGSRKSWSASASRISPVEELLSTGRATRLAATRISSGPVRSATSILPPRRPSLFWSTPPPSQVRAKRPPSAPPPTHAWSRRRLAPSSHAMTQRWVVSFSSVPDPHCVGGGGGPGGKNGSGGGGKGRGEGGERGRGGEEGRGGDGEGEGGKGGGLDGGMSRHVPAGATARRSVPPMLPW